MYGKKKIGMVILAGMCLMMAAAGCGSKSSSNGTEAVGNGLKEAKAAQAEIEKGLASAPKAGQDFSKVPDVIKAFLLDGAQGAKAITATDPYNDQYDSLIRFDVKIGLTQVADQYRKNLQQLGQKFAESSGTNYVTINGQVDLYAIIISIEKSLDIKDGTSVKVAYHLNMKDPKARELAAQAQKGSQ